MFLQLCVCFTVLHGVLSLIETSESCAFSGLLKDTFDANFDQTFLQGIILFIHDNGHEQNHNQIELFKHIYGNTLSSCTTFNVDVQCQFTEGMQKDASHDIGHFNLMYLFISPTVENLNNSLICLKSTFLWRPRTRMILVSEKQMSMSLIEEIFRYIWNQKILNFIIVTTFDEPIIIGFNPFLDNFFQILKPTNAFYNKLKNLHRHELNVILTRDEDMSKMTLEKVGNETIYGGKDGELMMSIIRHINATYNITILTDEMSKDDNPFLLMNRNKGFDWKKLPLLERFKTDFIMDAQELLKSNATEFLYPHGRDDIVIIVPKAPLISQSAQFIKLLKEGFAGIIFFFAVICPIVWHIFYICETKIYFHIKKNSIVSTIMNNLRLLLGSGLPVLPKHFVENFFIIWLLFCNLIINYYFQSVLACVLTVSVHEPEVRTIQDLIKSNYRPAALEGVIKEATEVLKATGQEELIAKFRPMPDYFIYISKPDYKKFVAGRAGSWNYDRADFGRPIRSVFRIVEESLIPCFQSFQTTNGSPYYDMLNVYIRRILESGLRDLWKDISQHHYIWKIGGPVREGEIEGYKSIGMEKIALVLYLLLSGLGVSTVVFIGEWLHYLYTVKKT